MRLLYLILGTLSAMFFVLMSLRGKNQEKLLEPLDEEFYPIKALYTAGLSMQKLRIFRLRGKAGAKLREAASLYYGSKYAEYYSRMIWAQVLTYTLLAFSLFMLLAGALGTGFFAFMGIVASALAAYYFFTYVSNKINERTLECEGEFSNAISKMALLVNSGMILNEAWKKVAYGKEGTFYDLMRQTCDEMDNGTPMTDAIYNFGTRCNSSEIKKFTSSLIQSLERGGGELPAFLISQSQEIMMFKRQYMLQKGEKAAGELLAPIGLMFASVIILVMVAALQSFKL